MSEKRVELSIRSKGKRKPKPIIPKLELFLEPLGDSITVRGRDKDGDDWYILEITPEGKLKRSLAVVDDIGLQVNRNGQILEAK